MLAWASRTLPPHWPKLVALAVLALGLRLGYLFQAADSPFFDTPIVDARSYTEYARELATDSWAGRPLPFWQAPFYPYFLAVLFSLFGENYYLPRLLQALAGTLTCLLVFKLGREVFSPTVGWIAALGAALYGPFLYFEGELLPTAWAVLFDAVLLLVLLWGQRRGGALAALVAGLMLGLGTLAVPNVLLFAPMAAWWMYRWWPAAAPRRRALHMAIFAVGLLMLVGPVTLRNRIVGGEWVLISFNAGVNFYLGNNPDYDRTVAARPGAGWSEVVDLPQREAGITQPGAGSNYLLGKSWEYIRTEPGGYLALLLHKGYLFWHGAEIPRNTDPYFAAEYSPLLRLLLWKYGLAFPFGLVSALALLGAAYVLLKPERRTPATYLVLLFAGVYMLSVVLFFVTGRYRLPAVPCLLLLAAYGACTLASLRHRPLYLSAGALAVLLLVTNAGSATTSPHVAAFHHYSLAAVYESKGMKTNALQHYRRAVELDPAHRRALLGLAQMYGMTQRYDDAAHTYQQFLDHYPDQDDVRLQFADFLRLRGQFQESAAEYQKLLVRQPDQAHLYLRLGRAEAAAGRLEQAEAAYLRALELGSQSAHYLLGQLYEAQGQLERAEQFYQQLIAQQPNHLAGLCHLADLLLKRGDEETAKDHLLAALALDPDNAHALHSMGTLEANQGQYLQALQRFERILQHHPRDLQARRSLSHLLLKTGQRERADAEYAHYQRLKRQHLMQQQTMEKTKELADQLRQMFKAH